MSLRPLVALLVLLLPGVAAAQIAPECEGRTRPADYDEQTQQDFLANYVALATTLSPLHGPVPHEPGHGAIGVDLGIIPPLSCDRRYVLGWTKTEDTNKSPVLPRPRVTFALPEVHGIIPYAGIAYLPPVPVGGIRNVVLSGEIGAGGRIGERLEVGGRFHATVQKTVGEVATPFTEDEEAVVDLYLASTFGVDAMAGWRLGTLTPYLALGFVDVSTFFYVGDDGMVPNNLHPYFGPAASLGVQGLLADRLRWAAEAYAAPGGHSLPDPDAAVLKPAARYGRIYTARIRLAWEL